MDEKKEDNDNILDKVLEIMDKKVGKPPSFIKIDNEPILENGWKKSRL